MRSQVVALADSRVRYLLKVKCRWRGISAEPLWGPIDLKVKDIASDLHLVITGGESGPNARASHPDWFRSLRDQCSAAGVAFFHKQNGSHRMVYDRDVDDPDWRRCGEVERQIPKGRWLNLAGGHGFHGERVVRINPVSKKAAGRLLDGREWNEFPEVYR